MPHEPPAQPSLSSNRLLLRPLQRTDQHAVYEALSHPLVVAHYGVRFDSFEATARQMDWYAALWREGTGAWWAICVADAPQNLLGAVGLNDLVREHRRAEIGYWLLPQHWGRGFAREAVRCVLSHAFGPIGLHRVAAMVEPENHASLRLLEDAGFRREGTWRACEWKDGRWLDLVHLSLLASDERAG